MMLSRMLSFASLAAVACMPFASAQEAAAPPTLTIGSKAPALAIAHYLHDRPELTPVTTFEAGKVYVVEFWATWCGPCVASMPHLSEIQAKYADKGVILVSISDEDLDTVKEFLGRKVAGEEEKTYRDLTGNYRLTTDPDRSSHTAYMTAAGENGIPTSFLVGKTGLIEWIGHPMSMDEPLAAVVAGTWDREVILREKAEKLAAAAAFEELYKDWLPKLRAGDAEGAEAVVEAFISTVKDPQLKQRANMLAMQINRAGTDTDRIDQLEFSARIRSWLPAIQSGDLKPLPELEAFLARATDGDIRQQLSAVKLMILVAANDLRAADEIKKLLDPAATEPSRLAVSMASAVARRADQMPDKVAPEIVAATRLVLADAVEKAPSATVFAHYGMVLFHEGKIDDAIAALKQALAMPLPDRAKAAYEKYLEKLEAAKPAAP